MNADTVKEIAAWFISATGDVFAILLSVLLVGRFGMWCASLLMESYREYFKGDRS